MDAAVIQAVMDDYTTAPISERLRAGLGFLKKINDTPDDVTVEDIAALEAQGITKDGIAEIAYVAFVYNILDRLADAFDFEVGSETHVKRASTFLHNFGYNMASLWG